MINVLYSKLRFLIALIIVDEIYSSCFVWPLITHPSASIYISLFFYGLGGGMLSPGVSSSLSISVGKENQGSASGFLGMVIPVGHVISPIISMPLYSVSPSYPYLLGSVLMFISFIFILSNNRHKWIRDKHYKDEFESIP